MSEEFTEEFTEEIVKAIAPKTADLFKPEIIDQVIAKITELAKEHEPDLSTVGSRGEIASIAYKVAQSKTFLNAKEKEVLEPINAKKKLVSDQGKKMRAALDELKKEVRKPLTDWEAEHEQKKTAIISQITALHTIAIVDIRQVAAGEIIQLIDKARAIQVDQEMGPLTDEANEVKEKAIADLNEKLAERNTYDAEQAELEELRKKLAESARLQAEAEQKARDEELKRKEVEAAEAERKRVAEEEQYRKELADKLAAEQAETEKKRAAEQKRLNAERAEAEAARKVEDDKRQKEREEQIRKDAAAKAIADAEAAQKAKEAMEAAKREADRKKEEQRVADKKHRRKTEEEAVDALNKHLINNASQIVALIADGKIPHLSINY